MVPERRDKPAVAILHAVLVAILATAAAGCGASHKHQKSGAPLTLTARLVMRTTAGTERGVAPEQPVFAGDMLAVYFSASEPLLLYVVEQQPGAKERLLQPAGSRAPANVETRLPGDSRRWLRLSSSPGRTVLGIVASREQRRSEQALFAMVLDVAHSSGADEVTVAIDPTYPVEPGSSLPPALGVPRRTFRLRSDLLTQSGAAVRASSRGSPLVLVLAVDTRAAGE